MISQLLIDIFESQIHPQLEVDEYIHSYWIEKKFLLDWNKCKDSNEIINVDSTLSNVIYKILDDIYYIEIENYNSDKYLTISTSFFNINMGAYVAEYEDTIEEIINKALDENYILMLVTPHYFYDFNKNINRRNSKIK